MKPDDLSERFRRGLEVREDVLGADYVAKSLDQSTEFTRPIQVLVTEICWADIWSRPGLERRTRSMLNLAMLTALNRSHELAAHVRGAINNGVSEVEIQEVLLQTAVYVGVPAALESFRVADRVLSELRAAGAAADGVDRESDPDGTSDQDRGSNRRSDVS